MSKREIALDTETTGLSPKDGHRVIEIGAVEMINRVSTGKHFHAYINPERTVSQDAVAIHGLDDEFLADKPTIDAVIEPFLDFIADSKLVIHNAPFDMKFLNHELKLLGIEKIKDEQAFCTLQYARRKFPGSPASLDALCKRFGIDNTERTLHGALLDAELLAEMYLELMGGRQDDLIFSGNDSASFNNSNNKGKESGNKIANISKIDYYKKYQKREFKISDSEKNMHEVFLESLGTDVMWNKNAK